MIEPASLKISYRDLNIRLAQIYFGWQLVAVEGDRCWALDPRTQEPISLEGGISIADWDGLSTITLDEAPDFATDMSNAMRLESIIKRNTGLMEAYVKSLMALTSELSDGRIEIFHCELKVDADIFLPSVLFRLANASPLARATAALEIQENRPIEVEVRDRWYRAN